ncbi:TorF family putative porin [Alteromonas macleodii]|uniref:TorF family putative porin n=1 Tax=Alteromonas macleodii TaxID=28108 RepID=UPI00068CCE0F|nr:TorF family putative porin [Alteromonas macleodii]
MKKLNSFFTSTHIFTVTIVAALYSSASFADWSANISAVSDYTFNGVSQTQNDPALQGGVDKAFDNGTYAGTWASNVDFGGDTNLEWDFYVGRYQMLTETVSLDYGIAYYSYHGGDDSSDGNYPEVYTKFGYASDYGSSELNFWYTWDYFGTGAKHAIAMVAHTFEFAPNHHLRASFDVSNSLDSDKWLWNGDDTSFYHYRLAYQTSYEGFDFEIAAENTNLDFDTADERIVFGVSKTFSF